MKVKVELELELDLDGGEKVLTGPYVTRDRNDRIDGFKWAVLDIEKGELHSIKVLVNNSASAPLVDDHNLLRYRPRIMQSVRIRQNLKTFQKYMPEAIEVLKKDYPEICVDLWAKESA